MTRQTALALALLAGCGGGGEPTTATTDAGSPVDAAPTEGGEDAAPGPLDAGHDAGPIEPDAGGEDAATPPLDAGHDAGPPPPAECELLARDCDVGTCKVAIPEGRGTECAPSGTSESRFDCDLGECRRDMQCLYAERPGEGGGVRSCRTFCRLGSDDCAPLELHCRDTFAELNAYTPDAGTIPVELPEGFGLCDL